MEQTKTIKTENGELYVQGDKIIGRMVTEGNTTKYYKGDKLHREGDLPASIERNDARCFATQSINGVVTLEEYYRDGKRHRDGDRPACISRNTAGVVTYEGYWRNGERHRDGDLPARIWRNEAGVVTLEAYYRDGKYHRDGDLPAYIGRNDTGVVTQEWYYRDGKKHRDGDRPAHIERNDAGVVTLEVYYRDDVNITADQIKAEKEKLAAANVNAAMKAELDAANAKITELQAQLDQLKANIKAALE